MQAVAARAGNFLPHLAKTDQVIPRDFVFYGFILIDTLEASKMLACFQVGITGVCAERLTSSKWQHALFLTL